MTIHLLLSRDGQPSANPRTTRRRLGGIMLAFAVAAVSPAVAATNPAPTPEYKVQPFDTLQFTVFQEADLSVKVKVTPQGNITYPLLGTISVAGLTVTEVERKITELLGRDYLVSPRVTAAVERATKSAVIVLGQVRTPAAYEMQPDESLSLLQVIARAGGFTPIAAPGRVTILRTENGRERKIIVDVAAIIKAGDKSKDLDLWPGDVISVPESMF
jgi:protein involved in polysaccharide export with SLBB domain